MCECTEEADRTVIKEQWYDGLICWIFVILAGLVAVALCAAVLWALGSIAWWCWKPLLVLLALWLSIGTAAAVVIVPDNQRNWLNVVGRSCDQIDYETRRVQKEYSWVLSYNDARVIACHRFWDEWWEVTLGFPVVIIGGMVLLALGAL